MTLTRPGAAHTPSASVPNRSVNPARARATSSPLIRPPHRSWFDSGLVPLLGRWRSLRCSLARRSHIAQLLGDVLRVRVGDEGAHARLGAREVLHLPGGTQ